jgi:hypothetical protein
LADLGLVAGGAEEDGDIGIGDNYVSGDWMNDSGADYDRDL